ncbi:MAG: exodeoxyribonuclease V subunit gamma [Actinomycetota bacterium]
MSSDPPTSNSGLRIHHGTRVEDLTEALARDLVQFPADPFAPEVIVVPNTGIGDWLQSQLPESLGALVSAERGTSVSGVLANFRLLTTNSFTTSILARGRREPEQAWSRSRLMWYVHRAIEAMGREAVPGAADDRLRTADAIADLFDHYATHRPSMLQYWKSGRSTDGIDPGPGLPESMRWQVDLYARVCGMIDQESMAEALGNLRTRLATGDGTIPLPERISVFGFSSLSPTLRLMLAALASVRPVGVFLLHPLAGPWTPRPTIEDLLVPRAEDVLDVDAHRLTARWGRTALETPRMVSTGPVVEVPAPGPPASLLGAVQAALTSRSVGRSISLDSGTAQELLSKGDGTIQVHACHGRARQVEVLRDALLHLLNADPSLHLDDIVVICPNIEAFAPMIPAIFGADRAAVTDGASSVAPTLRVRVAELELAQDAPVVEAFTAVLQLLRSRFGVSDVLGFLSRPVVMKRFGVDSDTVARLIDLVDDLRVDFGIDGENRASWGVPADVVGGTWRFALTRLMMGLAVSAPTPLIGPGDVVPYDDVSVADIATIAALAELLERLESDLVETRIRQGVGEWMAFFARVVDRYTSSRLSSSGREELLTVLDDVETAAEDSGISDDQSFTFDEIDFVVRQQLTRRLHRPLFRTGDITVSRLPPVQGVPYRVIALLGADEDMFAQGGANGDDVLGLHPCLGEPNPSTNGRQGLLNILLAARDAVIVTCEGADINTNKPVPLAVPIQELLEACIPLVEAQTGGNCRLLTQHPRQNFHPSVLTPGLVYSDRPFTFDLGSKRAAEGRLGGEGNPRVPQVSRLPRIADAEESFQLAALVDGVVGPVSWFAETTANIRIDPLFETETPDAVHLHVDPLRYSKLCRDLLGFVRRSPEYRSTGDTVAPSAHWGVVARSAGMLPPGALADAALVEVSAEVAEFMSAVPPSYFDVANYREVDIDLPMGVNLGRLQGTVGEIVGHDLVRLSFRRPTEALRLGPALELAALTLADPAVPYRAVVVTRAVSTKRRIEPVSLTVRGEDAVTRRDNARLFLAMAGTVAVAARESLVPVFPRASAELGRGRRSKARKAFEEDCSNDADIGYFFGTVSWEDLMSQPAEPGDPPGSATSRVARFAEHIWSTFDRTMSVGSASFSSDDIVAIADEEDA